MKHLSPSRKLRRVHLGLLLLLGSLAGCEGQRLTDQQGQTFPWDSLRGQWVAVNYWAEWCAPCKAEIPELNRLDQDPDVTVLGVNFDGLQGDELRQVSARMGIHFRVLAEDMGAAMGWQTPLALPATFLVDPQGELVEARFGEQTRETLRRLIDSPVTE